VTVLRAFRSEVRRLGIRDWLLALGSGPKTGFFDNSDYPYTPEILSELDDLKGAATVLLFEYWLAKKGSRRLPAWDDFEFMDLYKIAPLMAVLDVDGSGDANKLRYRFMGTQIVEYRKYRRYPDLTGRTFEQADRSYDPKAMHDAYTTCLKTEMPVLMRGQYQTDQSRGEHERIILPWSIGDKVARLTNVLDRFPIKPSVP
jgi:hypothetical protein